MSIHSMPVSPAHHPAIPPSYLCDGVDKARLISLSAALPLAERDALEPEVDGEDLPEHADRSALDEIEEGHRGELRPRGGGDAGQCTRAGARGGRLSFACPATGAAAMRKRWPVT